MDEMNIDQALDMISSKLHVSKEIETELLAEIRTHLEEAVAYSRAKGGDEQDALRKAVEEFGMDEVGSQLQEVHAGRESIEAIAATALPILLALILRWLAFVPEGSYQAWNQLLVQPAFWTVALTALFVPGILFRRWGFALIGWGVFWLITIIFVTFPHAQNW
jgi:hypothetical protein